MVEVRGGMGFLTRNLVHGGSQSEAEPPGKGRGLLQHGKCIIFLHIFYVILINTNDNFVEMC